MSTQTKFIHYDFFDLSSGLDSMGHFGIYPLTGEADKTSQRILCDLDERGVRLMESFYGNTVEVKTGNNWNNGTEENPHIASIMIPRTGFMDVLRFAVATDPAYVAALAGDYAVYGFKNMENYNKHRELLKALAEVAAESGYSHGSVQTLTMAPAGDRNTHQMSGRTI